MKKINQLYVLGGHRLSTTYMEKLMRARDQGLIHFKNISFIDPDSHCVAKTQLGKRAHPIEMEYAPFVAHCLRDKSDDTEDSYLIPDHTAPHVLFQVFLQMIRESYPGRSIVLEDRVSPFGTLYEHQVTSGVLAVSFSTWVCPLECEEPSHCPGINSKRLWDLRKTFKEYQKKNAHPSVSFHGFFCNQLVYGVASIPFSKIEKAWQQITHDLDRKHPIKLIVATFSKCHGIIGQACISSAPPTLD